MYYPQFPDFFDEIQFCLITFDFVYEFSQPVSYAVKLGDETCMVSIQETSQAPHSQAFDRKILQVNDVRNVSVYVATFSAHLYRNDMNSKITSTYTRFPMSWNFDISKKNQQFPDEIESDMRRCLEALVIENAGSSAKEPHAVDSCVEQKFTVSYPKLCTSLVFVNDWKRGQTIAEASWTFTILEVHNYEQCVNWGRLEKYSPVLEFTDRYVQVKERQLRSGINRVCNTFFFTTTFGTGKHPLQYGPYKLNVCVSTVNLMYY